MLYLSSMGVSFVDSFIEEIRSRVFRKSIAYKSSVIEVNIKMDFRDSLRFHFEGNYFVIQCISGGIKIKVESIESIKGSYDRDKIEELLSGGLLRVKFKKPVIASSCSVAGLCNKDSLVLFFVDVEKDSCYTYFSGVDNSEGRYIKETLGRDKDWISQKGSYLGRSDIILNCFELVL